MTSALTLLASLVYDFLYFYDQRLSLIEHRSELIYDAMLISRLTAAQLKSENDVLRGHLIDQENEIFRMKVVEENV